MRNWDWHSWPWNSQSIRHVRSVSAPGVWTRRISNVKNIAVPVAVIVGGVWGFWVYVNPNSLRPQDYQAHLSLEADTNLIRVLPDRAIVGVDMSVSNQSRTMIRTVGAFFEVRGYYSDQPSKREASVILNELLDDMNDGDRDERTPIHYFQRRSGDGTRISAGRMMPDQMVLASGEEYAYSIVTSVPCVVDVIEVTINLFYHKTKPKQGKKFEIVWSKVDDQLWASHKFDNEAVKVGTQGINWSDVVREVAIPRIASPGDPTTNECSTSDQAARRSR